MGTLHNVTGVCVGIAGCILGASGTILIRKSHLILPVCTANSEDTGPTSLTPRSPLLSQEEEKAQRSSDWPLLAEASATSTRLWITGMLLSAAISPCFSAVTIALTPACLSVILSGLTLVLNFSLAWLVLQERMTWLEIAGAVTVVLGTSLVVASVNAGIANVSSATEILAACARPNATAFLAVLFTFIASLGILSFLTLRAYSADQTDAFRQYTDLCTQTGCAQGACDRSAPFRGDSTKMAALCRAHPAFCAATSGLACGVTTLAGKACVIAWQSIFMALLGAGDLCYTDWLVAIGSLSCVLLGGLCDLYFMNKALRAAKAIVVTPFRTFTTLLAGTSGGVWLFRETPDSYVLFMSGLLLVLPGVACFAKPFLSDS